MKKSVKKLAVTILSLTMLSSVLTGCGGGNTSKAITVVSREDGSGTRGAFTELLGIAEDDVDNTVATAEITNSTSVMITTVAGDVNAIGYISMGSLDDSVKALKIDGVEANVENVTDGSYKVARPFNICTKSDISDAAKDFITYILSDDGQKVINEEGYISVESGNTYSASGVEGKITLAGSTSVAPVMEVLTEKYKELNPNVEFEIQQTGSSAGITSTIEGACDIGMSSRELKDTELSEGLTETKIAMDGICVVVNNESTVDELTAEQVKKIYVGEITTWSEIQE